MTARFCLWVGMGLAFSVPVWCQQSGELRKCVSAKGAISFQQAPCTPGARQVASRPYVTESAPTAEQVRARAIREHAARLDSAELSRRGGTGAGTGQRRSSGGGLLHRVSIARDDAACQRARRHREQTLEAVGLKRNYDLLQALNDNVAKACR